MPGDAPPVRVGKIINSKKENFSAFSPVPAYSGDGNGGSVHHLRKRQNACIGIVAGSGDGEVTFICLVRKETGHDGNGCVRARRQRLVDSNIDVHGVSGSVSFGDDARLR